MLLQETEAKDRHERQSLGVRNSQPPEQRKWEGEDDHVAQDVTHAVDDILPPRYAVGPRQGLVPD